MYYILYSSYVFNFYEYKRYVECTCVFTIEFRFDFKFLLNLKLTEILHVNEILNN